MLRTPQRKHFIQNRKAFLRDTKNIKDQLVCTKPFPKYLPSTEKYESFTKSLGLWKVSMKSSSKYTQIIDYQMITVKIPPRLTIAFHLKLGVAQAGRPRKLPVGFDELPKNDLDPKTLRMSSSFYGFSRASVGIFYGFSRPIQTQDFPAFSKRDQFVPLFSYNLGGASDMKHKNHPF